MASGHAAGLRAKGALGARKVYFGVNEALLAADETDGRACVRAARSTLQGVSGMPHSDKASLASLFLRHALLLGLAATGACSSAPDLEQSPEAGRDADQSEAYYNNKGKHFNSIPCKI